MKEMNALERWVDEAEPTQLVGAFQLCVALLQMKDSIDCPQIQDLIRDRLVVIANRHQEAQLLNGLNALRVRPCPTTTA